MIKLYKFVIYTSINIVIKFIRKGIDNLKLTNVNLLNKIKCT